MSFVDVREHRVHLYRLGQGDRIVVFVHGMVMDNLASWYFTIGTRIARRNRVVLYDLRGHGRTERTPTGYRIPDLVADLDALLDAIEVDRPVVLVGNSFGGLVALAYTMAHPERVEGLVMIDANMHDEHWNDDIAERFGAADADPGARWEEIKRYAFRYAGKDSRRKRNQLGRKAHGLVHRTSFVEDLSATPPFGPEDLRAVTCPVLALYGDESELAERARRMGEGLPRCEMVWFEGHSHLLLWENPEAIGDQVERWLETLD